MNRDTVLLSGGPCDGMTVAWEGWDEIRMVKCIGGYAPWPPQAGRTLMDHEIYRPSLDSPTIFVWAPLQTADTGVRAYAPHPHR